MDRQIEVLMEKHGKDAIREAMDKAVIIGGHSRTNTQRNEDWLMFCKRYGVVGQGTKQMRAQVSVSTVEREYKRDDNTGLYAWVEVTPYKNYGIYLKNGRREMYSK